MLIMFVASAAISYRDVSELRADVKELRRENQTMRDYLSAIYMQAPHLKPEESK